MTLMTVYAARRQQPHNMYSRTLADRRFNTATVNWIRVKGAVGYGVVYFRDRLVDHASRP